MSSTITPFSTSPVAATGARASSVGAASSSSHDQAPIRARAASSPDNGSNDDLIENIPSIASTTTCATLTLTPLHRNVCQKILQQKGRLSSSSSSSRNAPRASSSFDDPSTEQYLDVPRRRIRLKLCTEDVHVLDSDDDDSDCDGNNDNNNGNSATLTSNDNDINRALVTKYARTYRDGSTAASMVLGRNNDTCIKWARISRALCDVSLGRTRKRDDNRTSSLRSSAAAEMKADGDVDVILDDDDDDDKECDFVNETKFDDNRNPTMQHDDYVPTAWLSMRKPPRQHGVFLDGELVRDPIGRQRKLHHGAILSLYGPTGFAYRVDISFGESRCVSAAADDTALAGAEVVGTECKKRKPATADDNVTRKMVKSEIHETGLEAEEEAGQFNNCEQQQNDGNPQRPKQPASAASTTAAARHRKSRQHGQQLLLGECTCAMCMDILVQSTFASPCAHAFCRECAEELDPELKESSAAANTEKKVNTGKKNNSRDVKPQCPTCRGEVEGWIPARSFDTVVWSVALQGCFARDDAEVYLKRREECGDGVASQEHKDSVLNVGMDIAGSNGISVGSDVNYGTALGGMNSVAVGSGNMLQSAVRNGTNFPSMQPIFASSAWLVSSAESSIDSLQNHAIGSQHFGGVASLNPESQFSKTGSSADDAICLD